MSISNTYEATYRKILELFIERFNRYLFKGVYLLGIVIKNLSQNVDLINDKEDRDSVGVSPKTQKHVQQLFYSIPYLFLS